MATSGYGPIGPDERPDGPNAYWEAEAEAYTREHAATLGADRLVWCPEGLDEDRVGVLGDIRGQRVLEVGCGASQGSRWAAGRGAQAVGVDLSGGMLRAARRLGTEGFSLVQADATALPFADQTFDLAFSAFGALAFVPDLAAVHTEVARVLRPGGRWVFTTTHPFAWVFPDSPDPADLRVVRSYFGHEAYFERDATERLTYAEHHHTFQDHVEALTETGFRLEMLWEPQWPASPAAEWGGAWSRARGALVPSTLMIAARRRARDVGRADIGGATSPLLQG